MKWHVYLVQTLVVLGCLFGAIREPRVRVSVDPRAAIAVRRFHNFWVVLWVAWLALYATQTFASFSGLETRTGGSLWPGLLDVLWNTFANGANLAFLMLFIVMSRPTEGWSRLAWVYPFAAVLVLGAIEVFLVYGHLMNGVPGLLLLIFYGLAGGVTMALGAIPLAQVGAIPWGSMCSVRPPTMDA
jgi:hypothetical protein